MPSRPNFSTSTDEKLKINFKWPKKDLEDIYIYNCCKRNYRSSSNRLKRFYYRQTKHLNTWKFPPRQSFIITIVGGLYPNNWYHIVPMDVLHLWRAVCSLIAKTEFLTQNLRFWRQNLRWQNLRFWLIILVFDTVTTILKSKS